MAFTLIGERKSLAKQTKEGLASAQLDIRQLEIRRDTLVNECKELEAIKPRDKDINDAWMTRQKELQSIRRELKQLDHTHGMLKTAQRPSTNAKYVELIARNREQSARAANPMRMASMMERSDVAQETIGEADELFDDFFKDPQKEVTPEDEEEMQMPPLDDYLGIPTFPSVPLSTPVHREMIAETSSSSSSSSYTPVSHSMIKSFEERLAALASPK